MIKNILIILLINIKIKWLFNTAQDVITYCRDWLNKDIIKIIMIIVKYITHNSYAISVVSSFNRLWAQISAVISCLKS